MSDAKFRIKHGMQFPFDAPDDFWTSSGDDAGPNPYPATDWAHIAARAIVADMTDRRGIKHGFEGLDEDVRREIVSSIAEIVREAQQYATTA